MLHTEKYRFSSNVIERAPIATIHNYKWNGCNIQGCCLLYQILDVLIVICLRILFLWDVWWTFLAIH